MPYTKKDYPDSFKNLDNDIRLKAIDILNAMIKDGYDEDNAIPISISQAKKWIDNASEVELRNLKTKDLTKHEKTSNSSRLQDVDVKVYYDDEKKQWAVKSVGAERVSQYFKTKKEAKVKAKEIADNKDSDVKVEEKS